ncbi:MAG TPA: GTPase ObgE, partial [Candidatus Babeliaceae bacterium]|nr:GTPase ObgE [Candidatus Babeliaceae bacterium]
MFVDKVRLQLSAGNGGNGVIAWRREKYIPKGGPCGGDGGKGGSIYIETDNQVVSLENYRNRRIIVAQNGQPGGPNLRTGKNGKDLTLKIPPGTLVKDATTGEVLYDFIEKDRQEILCKGGKGGKGNNRFKTSTNQAPYICTEGEPGETREIELELKLIADVGLIGMPNAGKSSLMSCITHLQVKIG